MSINNVKRFDPQSTEVRPHTHQDNWEVMKPFVKFSFKALKVIGITLIGIVKALPVLKHQENKNTTMTKR